MNQPQISKCLLLLPLLAAVVLSLSCGSDAGLAAKASGQSETSAPNSGPSAPPQPLSTDGQAALRAIIEAGNLPDLRWANFSDYDKHLKKFYEFYGYALPWVQGMQPTAQAQQVIAILQKADQKGLSAEDYDGSRWGARLAKLKPATAQPTELDAARFDAALTVCVMRYISDLHIGKVNPKHFDFGYDVQAKKYDLPEFLKEHIVDGSDVAGVLEQVEPP